ncbi:MAG: hypothetical protein ACRDRO_06040 [Pseudonocardiaceae bacterium]
MNLDAATLAGLADNPGELAGFGPIPAEMARELAAAARRWRAALIDEHTGQLTDLSVAYRPRRLLDLTVRARDQVCCFPGCRQPARRCDLDQMNRPGSGWLNDQVVWFSGGGGGGTARPDSPRRCVRFGCGGWCGPAPPAASTTSAPHHEPTST